MGELHRLPIRKWRQDFELTTLVETGSFKGDGIRAALRAGFARVISIELSPRQLAIAAQNVEAEFPIGGSKWEIRLGDSAEVLRDLLREDHFRLPQTRVLWWLDAHYPELYAGGAEGAQLPLLDEIHALVESKHDLARDIIAIDDWRIYEEIKNAAGPLPQKLRIDGALPAPGHGAAIRALLEPTHCLNLILSDGGYMVGFPKR